MISRKVYTSQIRNYSLLTLLSILILSWIVRIWSADISIPFVYKGDTLFDLMTIKTTLDNNWYFENKFLGTPFGFELYDISQADGLSFLILKLIGSLSNSFIAYNLFFIITFPLTTLATFFVLNKLKISNSVSVVISLIYTFLPYHFLRYYIGHIFLAAYYTIPLITLVLLSLWSEQPPFLSIDKSRERIKLDLFSKKSLLYIFICIVLGLTGVYCAYFGCFFIVVASISAFINRRNKHVFISSVILITIISTTVFLQLLPSIFYIVKNGVDQEVAHRLPNESEIYGLKIIQLLLPINGDNFPILKNLAQRYTDAQPPLQNENNTVSLGIIGSIGFLSLIFRIFFLSRKTLIENHLSRSQIYDYLTHLNIAAILYATIGGFSSIFALIVSPEIRAPNRISVFIAFFSLLTVALFLDFIKDKFNRTVFNFLLVLVLIVGLLDQTSPVFIPNYSQNKIDCLNDRYFIETIEKSVPTSSMIFQLPYVPFPENPPVYKMIDYEHFRAYLHSTNLKWSYGVMKGRHDWQLPLVQEPIDTFLAKIATVGFAGIYIDRNGYIDGGGKIEADLENKLQIKPVVSQNQRFAFFNIQQFKEEFSSHYSPAQLQLYKDKILYPIEVNLGSGFYNTDPSSIAPYVWANQKAALTIKNPSSYPRIFQISMSLATGQREYTKLYIESSLFSLALNTNSTPSPFVRTIELPPNGALLISFTSDAKQVYAPLDPRRLFFNIRDLRITEADEVNYPH